MHFSAFHSHCKKLNFMFQNVDMVGTEPRTSHMQSKHSTTELLWAICIVQVHWSTEGLHFSAFHSHCKKLNFMFQNVDMVGTEPRTSHMQSKHSTTELHPQLNNVLLHNKTNSAFAHNEKNLKQNYFSKSGDAGS